MNELELDGSRGEGGGQILRTALSVAALTGRDLTIRRIRANRRPPGLKPQHRAAVKAVGAICQARIKGDQIGETTLRFRPQAIKPGDYEFDIGTAGSTTLLLQTVLPVLLAADGASSVVVRGGTDTAAAPPWAAFENAFVPLIQRLGGAVRVRLRRHGFYPRGGGEVQMEVEPAGRWKSLDLATRGPVVSRRGLILVSGLPEHVGRREAIVLRDRLDLTDSEVTVEPARASSPGNVCHVLVTSQSPTGGLVTNVFTALGERGRPSEEVADDAASQAIAWEATGAAIEPHLTDQLLLPMALAARAGAGVSQMTTTEPSGHTRTQTELVTELLGVPISIEPDDGAADRFRIRVG